MMKKQSKNIVKGAPLRYNVAFEKKMVKQVEALFTPLFNETEKVITALFKSKPAQMFFTQDADIATEAKRVTDLLTKKFDALFNRESKKYAVKLVTDADRLSKTNLTASVKKLSAGITLPAPTSKSVLTILKASINENIDLIKTISQGYLGDIKKTVFRSITQGSGLSDVIDDLYTRKEITRRHARNVALDQTRKVYNNLNAERLKENNVQQFEWRHSGGGQKPRKDHIAMNGNIYSFNKLPVIDKNTGERGIPGQAYNCKCFMIPVLKFEK